MSLQNPKDTRQATPGDDFRRDAKLGGGLQADPELQEGPAGNTRIVIYAVAVAILLGAVFFGLNSRPSDTTASNPTPAATADNSKAAAPARDVTPNQQSGTTTGSAPAQPQGPKTNPTGTEVDRSKGPSTQ